MGALGPALLAAAPSCAMTAWTRWSACARAVVVTSGLDAEARAARTPSAAVHAPPLTCRAAAAAPPAAATAAAAAAQRPGSTRGSNPPVPPSAPRALRTMSPACDSTIEDIDGADGRTRESESSTPPTLVSLACRSAAESFATSRSISTAATRTSACGLHIMRSPAASDLDGSNVVSAEPPRAGASDVARCVVGRVSHTSRHVSHTSRRVRAADVAASASLNEIPARPVDGGDSNTPATPCTMASRAAGVDATARRIASLAAARTAGWGCAQSGGTASPRALPRHSSGAMSGTHRSNAVATTTDARDVGSAR